MKTALRKIVRPAFTLIELVITIVVIGILSAALVATYSDVSSSAQSAAQKASLSAVQSQIAIHLGAHQALPSVSDLTAEVANLTYGGGNTLISTSGTTKITILAFSDAACSTPITGVTQLVACVNLTGTNTANTAVNNGVNGSDNGVANNVNQ